MLTFFGEAKKVSGAHCRTAQRHQEKFHSGKVSAQALVTPVLKVSQNTCPEVLYPSGFRDISPTGGELEKRRGRRRRRIAQKRWPKARLFRAFQRRALANPRKQGTSRHPARKYPIYKGFRGTYPETLYLYGVAGMPLCAFDHYEAPKKPLRRSRRRGAAWRLDCLSASELSSPPTSKPAARGFLRLGVAFLC